MNGRANKISGDWAGHIGPYMLAWGLPTLVIAGGIFADPLARTLLWTGALAWKGTACVLNARRCGRTHCRFTGPFYLVLILPVALHGFGFMDLGRYAWWALGMAILLGGKLIWWVSETAWGQYSAPGDPPGAR